MELGSELLASLTENRADVRLQKLCQQHDVKFRDGKFVGFFENVAKLRCGVHQLLLGSEMTVNEADQFVSRDENGHAKMEALGQQPRTSPNKPAHQLPASNDRLLDSGLTDWRSASHLRVVQQGHPVFLHYLVNTYKLEQAASHAGCEIKLIDDDSKLLIVSSDGQALQRFLGVFITLCQKCESDEQTSRRLPEANNWNKEEWLTDWQAQYQRSGLTFYIAFRHIFILGSDKNQREQMMRAIENDLSRIESAKVMKKHKVATKKSVAVSVTCCDIASVEADVLVDFCNMNSSHDTGMSRGLAQEAGSLFGNQCHPGLKSSQIQSLQPGEVVSTSGGHLCQYILHVACPDVGSSNPARDQKVLQHAVGRCLEEAARLGTKSIAFPGAVRAFPSLKADVFANAMLHVIGHFISVTGGASSLKEISIALVNSAQQLENTFSDALDKSLSLAGDETTLAPASVSTPTGAGFPSMSPSSVSRSGHTDSRAHSAGVVGDPAEDVTAAAKPTSSMSSCPVCFEEMAEHDMTPLPCGHKLCEECLDGVKKSGQEKCPTCQVPFGRITGDQPVDATMSSTIIKTSLPGYEGYHTIEIHYRIPAGVQTEQHRNPGKSYAGDYRVAYLPNSAKGKLLLQLLQRAFDARLIFTIGHSPTRGVDDVVTWNDIHHKTSMRGGP